VIAEKRSSKNLKKKLKTEFRSRQLLEEMGGILGREEKGFGEDWKRRILAGKKADRGG